MSLLIYCAVAALLFFSAGFLFTPPRLVPAARLWQASRPFGLAPCGLAVGTFALLLNGCGGSAPTPTEAHTASSAPAASTNACSFSFTGFDPKETGANMWWRWSPAKGEIHIIAAQPMDISIEGQIVSAQPPNATDVLLNGIQQAQIANASTVAALLKLTSVHLNAGENVLAFVSHNKGIRPASDPRLLAIAVYNLQTHALNGGTCTLEP